MNEQCKDPEEQLYDRELLLYGSKRNKVLSLQEVRRYGSDSFSDPDYVRLYGMTPTQWYGCGIRLLGRTVVECTRDALSDRIGRDVAAAATSLPQTQYLVVDPFTGSCNTLYWILQHVPRSRGIAFELDPHVYELTRRNIASLNTAIELRHGDYRSLLNPHDLPSDHAAIVFVAPPWSTALDEAAGLDLRRTEPPITEIIVRIAETYPNHPILFAIQVYEKANAESMSELKSELDWSTLKIYDLNGARQNHGILLGAIGCEP